MTLLPTERKDKRTDYWNLLYDAKDRNTILTATVIACKSQENLQGLVWEVEFYDVPNVRGVIPASETGLPTEKMMNFFVGKEINIRIKGIDKKNNLVTCTRRELVEESKSYIINTVKEGTEFDAQVVFVTETWLGIDIGGGIIKDYNLRDARVSRSLNLHEIYLEGENIRAVITKIDKEQGTIKVDLIDPWESVKYSRGDIVTGTVVKLGLGNIFVSLCPGVVGIAPYPATGPKPELGERLICKVNTFNPSEKSISLALFDPEIIRGRRKNRAYWRQQKKATN